MTGRGVLQIVLYLVVLVALVRPLGGFMARVYEGQPTLLGRVLGPLERMVYRAMGTRADREDGWKTYAWGVLVFNVLGLLVVYALQRFQAALPLDPQQLPAVAPDLAFNTATSFATNTNWQSYGGESTLGYLVQMLALTYDALTAKENQGVVRAVALFGVRLPFYIPYQSTT